VLPLLKAIMLATAACSLGALGGKSSAQESQSANELRYLNVVITYIQRTRGWPDGTYTVEFKRRDGNTLIFWVLYKDDFTQRSDGLRILGGGKSFEADVNIDTGSVEREFHFQ